MSPKYLKKYLAYTLNLLDKTPTILYYIDMASEYTNNLTDGEKDILRELAQDFDTDTEPPTEEEFSEDELDAMRENADREIFAAIDEMYAQA